MRVNFNGFLEKFLQKNYIYFFFYFVYLKHYIVLLLIL